MCTVPPGKQKCCRQRPRPSCRTCACATAAVGPSLDESVKKLKADPKAVLQEILEPSRNIEEKYRKQVLELDDETFISGNVIAEDEKSLTIQTGPTVDQAQKIDKKSIASRRSSLSPSCGWFAEPDRQRTDPGPAGLRTGRRQRKRCGFRAQTLEGDRHTTDLVSVGT